MIPSGIAVNRLPAAQRSDFTTMYPKRGIERPPHRVGLIRTRFPGTPALS